MPLIHADGTKPKDSVPIYDPMNVPFRIGSAVVIRPSAEADPFCPLNEGDVGVVIGQTDDLRRVVDTEDGRRGLVRVESLRAAG